MQVAQALAEPVAAEEPEHEPRGAAAAAAAAAAPSDWLLESLSEEELSDEEVDRGASFASLFGAETDEEPEVVDESLLVRPPSSCKLGASRGCLAACLAVWLAAWRAGWLAGWGRASGRFVGRGSVVGS